RHDRGDRLPAEVDVAVGEDGPRGRREPVAFEPGLERPSDRADVGGGDDAQDAVEGGRGVRVHRADRRVGVRAPHEGEGHHARQDDVVEKLAPAPEATGVADSGFSPFLRTQPKFEYTRPICSGSRPASRANRCTFSQSLRTISGVADECGTHVSAYFATRRSTGSMFVTVCP